MKEATRLKCLFDKAKAENASEGIGYFSNGRLFYGRVIRESGKSYTIIGWKDKRLRIYTFVRLAEKMKA